MSVTFTKEMIEGAQQTEKEYGVPVEITLGQIILESSGSYENGLSGLAAKAKNLFGIKAGSSWNGRTVTMPTKEHTSGGTVTVNAAFRAYDSYADSIKDHAKLFQNERYQKQVKGVTNYEEYARGIARAGYATDPSYAEKLIGIIKSNNLSKYSTGEYGTAAPETGADAAAESGGNSAEVSGIAQHLTIGALVIVCVLFGVLFLIGAFDRDPVTAVRKRVSKT